MRENERMRIDKESVRILRLSSPIEAFCARTTSPSEIE